MVTAIINGTRVQVRRVVFLGICEACRMYADCSVATSIGPILCADCLDQFEADTYEDED